MTANIYLISGGTNYYISLDGTKRTYYSGSGTPWTVQNTTPYDLAMNDVTGQRWSPRASQRQEMYGGGPPFRNGQTLIYDSYGNVTETVPIQMYATSHDNAVKLLTQLRQILNTALYSAPCVLAVQPDGATNTAYYEIYGADVQEDAKFINDESQPFQSPQSKGVLRAQITWRRSPHAGAAALTTLINASTFTNDGASNVVSYGTVTGDLLYEGSPINISIPGTTAGIGLVWMASIMSRVKTASGSATGTLTSTTPVVVFTAASVAGLANLRNNAALKLRVGFRTSATSTPSKVQFQLEVDSSTSGDASPLQYSPWVTLLYSSSTQWCDLGVFPLDMLKMPNYSTLTLYYTLRARSSDGTSCSATVDYLETLLYYDFAKVEVAGGQNVHATNTLEVIGAQNLNGTSWHPQHPQRAYQATSGLPIGPAAIRGTVPRAWSGASLWLAWASPAPTGAHTTTATSAVTVKHAPQYTSLRGNG